MNQGRRISCRSQVRTANVSPGTPLIASISACRCGGAASTWSQEWASEPVRAYRLAYYFQPSIDLSDLTNLKVAPIQTVCTVVLDRHGTVLSQERGNYVGLSKASSGAN